MRHRRRIAAAWATAALALPAAALAHPGHGHGPLGGTPAAPHPHPAHGALGGELTSHFGGEVATHPGHGQDHNPLVGYVFEGLYAGDGSVAVQHGNRFVHKAGLVGSTVQFDLSNARLTVADTNGDGSVSADDVQSDDKVLVKARLQRLDPGERP